MGGPEESTGSTLKKQDLRIPTHRAKVFPRFFDRGHGLFEGKDQHPAPRLGFKRGRISDFA